MAWSVPIAENQTALQRLLGSRALGLCRHRRVHHPTEELEAAVCFPQAGFCLLLVKSYVIQLLSCCCSIIPCSGLENRKPHWKAADPTES